MPDHVEIMASSRCPDIVVAPGGHLTSDELGHHLSGPTGPDARIDLRRLSFIDPAGLVSLAVIAERAVTDAQHIAFSGPTDPGVANYLARMRVGEHLDQLGADHDLPDVHERDVGARLVELHRFDGSAGLEDVVAALVQTYLERHPATVQPLYTALHEIASNAIQHSGRPHGYAALQRFDRSHDVVFAVADAGVGLRARLAQRFTIPDDRIAIATAAQTHASTMTKPGRGRGIARVIAVTGQRGGSVTLLSGSARAVFAHGDPRPQFGHFPSPHPGTLVTARLSL
jgi:hypothetical protein